MKAAPSARSFSVGHLTPQDDLALLSITVVVDTISAANARRYFRNPIDAHVRPAPDRRRRPGRRLSLHRPMRQAVHRQPVMVHEMPVRENRPICQSRGRFERKILGRPLQIQEGGGTTELTRRCRSAPLAALVPGQGGGSNRVCVGHWLDAEPSTHISSTLSLEERGRLARSTRYPAPSRQGDPFDFSRQAITDTRRSSRFGRHQTAARLREWMRWSIAPTDEFVGVCGCLDSLVDCSYRRVCGSLWVSGFLWIPVSGFLWIPVGVCGCLDSALHIGHL